MNFRFTPWECAWLLWGLGFVALETTAIVQDRVMDEDRTLSDHLRLWLRTDTKRGRTAWLVLSGGFATWFIVHIASRNVA